MGKKIVDPYAAREFLRYKKPIPSREIILQYAQQHGKPITIKKLQKLLNLKKPEQFDAFTKRLAAMERDGQLIRNRNNEYGPVSKMNLIPGRIMAHREGFGFVVPDDGSNDLFLPPQHMRAVFDGDRVLVRPTKIDRRGRRECALVQVLECNTTQVVGRLTRGSNDIQYVIPDNKKITHDIIVPKGQENGAQEGQIVSVLITCQPTYHQQPSGKIIEILGEVRAPGMEIDIAIRSHGLSYDFSSEIQHTLKTSKLYKELKPQMHYPDREDLRHLPLVTIDGEDAMDFDDAVYCEKKSRGFRLIVAIADVSFYVKPDSDLDLAAYNRGNSVYFPGRVIPMLPEKLSNNLCSLKPLVDRFCMVCDISLNNDAEIIRYRFYPGIMHSKARLTYAQVSNMLNNKDISVPSISEEIYSHLKCLHSLYLKLQKKRFERGALDFETIETKVIFDENKKIKSIIPIVRNDAHKMIEEAMLCANVCAAKFLVKHKSPALYRIHEGPTPEKLNDLRHFLKEFGLTLRGGAKPTSQDYAKLLENVSQKKYASLINTVLLRSLKQATYSPLNEGHFGLAYDAYTHFTSPIRRYPDLCVHRQIKSILENQKTKMDSQLKEDVEKKLYLIGEHCSFTERRADEATRDAMTALKCEFMISRVGETFQGLITGVTGFGIFVELTGIFIDGLVHVTTLPSDYYIFDPAKHRLTGERGGLKFNLGDVIRVKVTRVDIDDKKIDLELVGGYKNVKHKN